MKKLGDILKGVAGVMLLAALVTASVTTILGGCRGKKEVVLPFETIERADIPGTGEEYEGEEPKLAIIADATELDTLGNTVSLDAQAQLQDLDFDQYFAIVVFEGQHSDMPPLRSGVEVQRISRKGSTITIYAHSYEPVEGYEQVIIKTSPYHLVKMRKGENMQGEFQFVLGVDGTVVSQQTHRLP